MSHQEWGPCSYLCPTAKHVVRLALLGTHRLGLGSIPTPVPIISR